MPPPKLKLDAAKVSLTANTVIASHLDVEGSDADRLSELTGPETSYQQLVNSFGSTVASGRRLAASQSMLTQQVDGSRDQLAGVSL